MIGGVAYAKMNTCDGGPETCTETDVDNIEPFTGGISSSTWFTLSAPEIEIVEHTSKKSLLCGLRLYSFDTSRGIDKIYAKWCNSLDTDRNLADVVEQLIWTEPSIGIGPCTNTCGDGQYPCTHRKD